MDTLGIKTLTAESAELPQLTKPISAQPPGEALRVRASRFLRRWWDNVRFGSYAVDYLLMRCHRMGWHPDLDRAALEELIRRQKKLPPR